jgi:hypothetical protein
MRRTIACLSGVAGRPKSWSTTRPRERNPVRSISSAIPTILFYDAARKRLYVSGGEGYLDVIQEQNANAFARVAHTATAAGARTSLFVREQARLYLAVPHRASQKAEVRIFEAR